MTPNLGPFEDQTDDEIRAWAASRFLHGDGLDIGALHRPLPVPPGARVRYVDRMTAAELREQYPELAQYAIVEPDVVDNGETLQRVEPSSQDFLIASHFIEHTQDPIGTLMAFCRVVKPGGIILLVVPERNACFDRDRPLTTLDHLIQDHELGAHLSRNAHYVEYAELVDRASGNDAFHRALVLAGKDYSIHFHVWTGETFLEHVSAVKRRYGLPIELIAAIRGKGELVAVFRRR